MEIAESEQDKLATKILTALYTQWADQYGYEIEIEVIKKDLQVAQSEL